MTVQKNGICNQRTAIKIESQLYIFFDATQMERPPYVVPEIEVISKGGERRYREIILL